MLKGMLDNNQSMCSADVAPSKNNIHAMSMYTENYLGKEKCPSKKAVTVLTKFTFTICSIKST